MNYRPFHTDVRTTDLFWVDNVMFWTIHLKNGRSVNVSDTNLRLWLRKMGEKIGDNKISYRQFARYGMQK